MTIASPPPRVGATATAQNGDTDIPPAPDTDRPRPQPPPDLARVIMLFLAGKIAREARATRLEGHSVDEAHRLLVERGFRPRVERLFAGRGGRGEALFHLRDGGTTVDPTTPECIVVLAYAHTDGSLVRVYPEGDPTGRRAPAGVPSATKAVCMFPPRAWVDEDGTPHFSADTAPSNEAFRVTESGEPMPRSYRRVDGVEPKDGAPLESWRAAISLVGTRGVILLRG